MVDGDPTPEKILALTGLTLPKLRAVAEWSASSGDDLATLRKLGVTFKDDANSAWRMGRHLAAIIVAWVLELRAKEAAAKKAAKG